MFRPTKLALLLMLLLPAASLAGSPKQQVPAPVQLKTLPSYTSPYAAQWQREYWQRQQYNQALYYQYMRNELIRQEQLLRMRDQILLSHYARFYLP